MSGSRRVNFRESPSGSPSSRYSSDSGLGSLSDKASTAANPDRSFTAHDVQSQWTDLAALQEGYRDLLSSKDRWKQKALRLDEEATNARKREKETDAKWRAIVSRNEELEDEKSRIFKEKKSFVESNDKLQAEVESLRAQLAEANAYIQSLRRNSPPVMSGAVPADAKPPRRTSSKREKENFEQGQKKRLEKRMGKEPDVKSETTTSSKQTRSSKRGSYIEKWGPAEPRAPVPPSPTSGRVQYSSFSQSTQLPPTLSATTDPTYSKVPRSVHPSVNVVTAEPYYEDGYVEDGSYHYYPLPNETVRGHRSKHSK